MKKIFLALIVFTIVLVYDVSKQDKNTIIIYSSMEQYRGEEMQKQLSEKFPDLQIRVMYVATAKSAAKISVEQEETDADILVGLETSYLEKIKDFLATINDLPPMDYMDGLESEVHENKYVTWERQAGAFIINKDVIEKYGLNIPTSYADLLKPEYKNLIVMPDPKSSGTGYFFYKSLVNTLGDDEALAYLDALENNVKQFTESGSGPIKLLIQGETAIGLGLTFQAVTEINKNSPFEIIYPEEGSPYSLTGTAMIKGREEDNDIRKVYDFIITDFLKYDKEKFSPEKILNNQVNSVPNYPQKIHYADMSGIESIDEKERLLNLWKY